ncbi:hypothetical protein ACFWA5_44250 [Streptomyces mirabilis]|uniref:hypothetical protein n=1 Tax=Streptomyces mirabilis TaxID=68239 RepID=UPI003651CE43
MPDLDSERIEMADYAAEVTRIVGTDIDLHKTLGWIGDGAQLAPALGCLQPSVRGADEAELLIGGQSGSHILDTHRG